MNTHGQGQPPPGLTTAYIGLGANLGAAWETLQHALQQLQEQSGIQQLEASSFYSSAPVDSCGPDYINAVARVQTTLPPLQLLDLLQRIEQEHGRERPYRNAPRTLDLDLLLYGSETINLARLIVPHPRMHQRAFVLKPLQELAPALRLDQGTIDELLAACSDQQLHPLGTGPAA